MRSIAVLSALISFGGAIVSIYFAAQGPTIYYSLVPRVRLAANQGDDKRYVYIQPVLAALGRSDKVELLTAMELTVRPLAGGAPAVFSWTSVSRLDYDPKAAVEIPIFVSDPVPIVVSAGNPETPLLLFTGPPRWSFQGGASYCLVLSAQRLSDRSRPLRAAMRVTVDPTLWKETLAATPWGEQRYDTDLVDPATCS